ncbi:hypothetical protein [Parachitinimonas caeni]|uniref:Uncharacterized protein n=1 Tax=Parachitinimonas caeni TaxID=3031301 RepID=A0ABT7DWH2_9NEIS|nr:hypothetical protein [Parachitinimonas caeni]MDK2124414.1 hypothetical protein [Parachitinimonas caeni]
MAKESDFFTIFINVAKEFEGVFDLLGALGPLFGLYLIFDSLVSLGSLSSGKFMGHKQPSLSGKVIQLLIGGALVSFATFTGILGNTLFDTPSQLNSAFLYGVSDASNSADKTKAAKIGILLFLRIVGLVAMLRGLILLNRYYNGTGSATIGQAVTFMIGGVLCVYVQDLAIVLNNTTGFNLITWVFDVK